MEIDGKGDKTKFVRLLKAHGKQRTQICFRVTDNAYSRLLKLAVLFEMEPSDYAKAVLYKDLGIWTERLDYRRKKRH